MALIRMYQRRGTLEQWNTGVIPTTVILQPGEIGIETDTGRFKIGNGTNVWSELPYYLPDNNPTNAAIRQGKNSHDVYAKLSPLAPQYAQTFTGIQTLVPQSNAQTPLVVSGLAGQSAVLQRWRSNTDVTLASIDQTGKLTAEGGALFNNVVNVNNNKVTNLATPTADADAVNKLYVDQAIAGLAWKEAVHLIAHGTGANVALTGATNTLVIDGHDPLVQADSNIYRVLLTAQTTASQNGIYLYTDNGTTYTLVRATDADTPVKLQGSSVYIQEGTLYGTSSWVQSNYTMDAFEEQVWVQFSGAALITAGNGLVKDSNVIDVVGTADRITANADSIDIASTYVGQTSIVTLGTVTTGTWEASVIGATKGGTGQSSYSVGDILYADTTTTLAKLIPGTAGHPLVSGGTGAAPSYAQVNTVGIADDAVTYDKMQNVSGQYKVLGRILSGEGNVEELNSDNLMTVINQGNTDIAFNLLPVGTTSTTVAQGDHTHTLDNLSDVVISGTPALRQVLKYDGTKWINELPSGGISIGATPPVDASSGDAWFDSTDGSLYVYYDDASGSPSAQWVQVKANSALEASILTRMSAAEARLTDLEADSGGSSGTARVADATERDTLYPTPIQGDSVFRADLGYEEKYYAAYNATTNPDGTKGTPGWYRYAGGAPLSQNYILNGDMEIAQRGDTVGCIAPNTRYSLDQWADYNDLYATYNRVPVSVTGQPMRYGLKVSAITDTLVQDFDVSSMSFGQKLESIDATPLRGKTVTLSFYVKFSSATFTRSGGPSFGDFRYEIGYNTSTTDSIFCYIDANYNSVSLADSYTFGTITNGSLPTTWTRVSVTGTVPTNANNIYIGGRFLNKSSVPDAGPYLSYEVTGVQLEEGPVATLFHRNQENIQAELAACQRYHYRINADNVDSTFGIGWTTTTTATRIHVPLPVKMRAVPSVQYNYFVSTHYAINRTANTDATSIALTASQSSSTMAVLAIGHASVAADMPMGFKAKTTSAYLGFSAEL